MDRQLVQAVREQIGAEDESEFRATMRDVANHGADGGFPGFTYYADTCEFYDNNKRAIWDLASEMAEEFGHKSVPEFVATFNCAPSMGDETGFKNALAWFALEEVARSIAN